MIATVVSRFEICDEIYGGDSALLLIALFCLSTRLAKVVLAFCGFSQDNLLLLLLIRTDTQNELVGEDEFNA